MNPSRVSRRDFLKWSAVAGTGAVLAACTTTAPATQPPAGTPSGSGVVVVEWWHGDPVELYEPYDKMAEAFNAANTDVQVEVKPAPGGDYETKINTMISAGEGPDLWMWFYPVERASHGAFENLTPYIEADGLAPDELWFPICQQRSMWQGNQYGLPRDLQATLLVYNKTLFDEMGVAYPQPGWTLDDFVAIALALTDAEKETWGTLYGAPGTLLWGGAWPWNMGFELISEDGRQVQGYLDSPASIAAIQWVLDLQAVHKVSVPNDIRGALGGYAFGSGKVGMDVATPGHGPLLDAVPFEWALIGEPVMEGREPHVWSDSVMYYMWSGGQKKDAAWQVIKFISSPEGTRIPHENGFWASPCPQVWLDLGSDQDTLLGPFWTAMQLPSRVPNYNISEHTFTCIFPEFSGIWTRYLQVGERPLEAIVQDAAANAQGCLDRSYADAS